MCIHTENNSAGVSPYLLISAVCLHLQSQNTSCDGYIYILVSFIFASGISSEFLYNAESEQNKECIDMSLGRRRGESGRDP